MPTSMISIFGWSIADVISVGVVVAIIPLIFLVVARISVTRGPPLDFATALTEFNKSITLTRSAGTDVYIA